MLDDPGKTTVLIGLAVGMKFIHSGAVIPRDLKPANILLDERGDARIGDLVSDGFNDLRLTMTLGVGRRLYMGRDMYRYEDAGCTAAVDVYSFAHTAYQVFDGERALPGILSPGDQMKKVVDGSRWPLPESMDATIQHMVKQGWSVQPGARGSIGDILEAQRRIGFSMTRSADRRKVAEFVATVDR
jgi:serine/threonine protein kinase